MTINMQQLHAWTTPLSSRHDNITLQKIVVYDVAVIMSLQLIGFIAVQKFAKNHL